MSDVVVTVPKSVWDEWIAEGDLPGEAPSGEEYEYTIASSMPPTVFPGERVYIVAHGRLRGYAPLVRVKTWDYRRHSLVRAGGAVAVTINGPIVGFRGVRYRWWRRQEERPFPEWRTP